jgi:hypothetical protein
MFQLLWHRLMGKKLLQGFNRCRFQAGLPSRTHIPHRKRPNSLFDAPVTSWSQFLLTIWPKKRTFGVPKHLPVAARLPHRHHSWS